MKILTRLWNALHPLGLLVAACFFGAALTPSLMPRSPIVLGLVAGAVAAIGYELGRLLSAAWDFMELPRPGAKRSVLLRRVSVAAALLIALACTVKAADWQNATRLAVGAEPQAASAPITIAAIALAVFLLLWVIFRSFGWVFDKFKRQSDKILPPRLGAVLALAAAVLIFWAIIEGAIWHGAMRVADSAFKATDNLIEPEIDRPTAPGKTGSSASLVDWKSLGRQGRAFIATGPSAEDIAAFQGETAMEPIRVYVGRRSADSAQARAKMALDELIRVGGFSRKILVVMVPTGTGWMDAGSQDPLEYIAGGDVATVAVQYSYLTSFLSLATNPEYGVEQARALFDTIYGYWKSLPKTQRPKLFVHGLSQGAFNSQRVLPLLDMLSDPIDGAFWVGSPFFSRYWSSMRDNRREGSPAWRPAFGNGSLARSMNQDGGLDIADTDWGPIRLVFLNYGSDAIVVFTFDSLFRKPAWLRGERAPDVSPQLTWFPVVTTFQIALDMLISLNIPGYGHYYIARDYIDGWAEVLDQPGWSEGQSLMLKKLFAER